MRGNSGRDSARGGIPGIIPAGAGHLLEHLSQVRPPADHPRRCGAILAGILLAGVSQGSSPQVRGIYLNTCLKSGLPRIIPAGAGHFSRSPRILGMWGDHPRRCGAFVSLSSSPVPSVGSSPQVRGIFGVFGCGIWWLGDHPHRCGAFDYQDTETETGIGSSPQVRGIYSPKRSSRVASRIIPAGAGHLLTGLSVVLNRWDHPRRCGAFGEEVDY